MDRIRRRLITEFHCVLEDFDEAGNGVFLADRPHVHDEGIASDLVPLPGQLLRIRLDIGQGNHVQVRMPSTRVLASLHLVRPDSTSNTVKSTATTSMFTFPKLMLGLLEMLEPFFQVFPVFDRQSDQKRPQGGFFQLDGIPPSQIGREGLSAPSDGAQRAQQMLLAELGRVQLDGIDREVVPEHQVLTAAMDLRRHVLMSRLLPHILRCVESAFPCLTVPIDPFG